MDNSKRLEAPVISWHDDDPGFPHNWSRGRKWRQVLLLTVLTFMVQYAGSAYTSCEMAIRKDFDTSHELVELGITALLFAYAIVPMFLAPIAEVFGRVPVYLLGYFGFLCFSIPTGVTMDISVMVIFRFIAGGCGSVGNTMVGGSITDLFTPVELGWPMTIYIVFGLLLPVPMGPLINGFVVDNPRLGYHWSFWFQIIFGVPVLAVLALGLEETRPIVLLKKRAQNMSRKTGEQWTAEGDDSSFLETMQQTLKMPWQLMFTDLTVAFFSLWLAFVWGITYGMLESISLVFRNNHFFSESQIGLIYISLIVALLLGLVGAYLQELWFQRSYRLSGSLVPEARLQIACIGSICVTSGLFFYAWTSPPQYNYFLPISAAGLTFFGIYTTYYAVFFFVCDNYSDLASSALSAAGFWRNTLAGIFPLFITQMYSGMGYAWASSTLAFCSLPMAVIPFALMFYGPKLRASSKYIES